MIDIVHSFTQQSYLLSHSTREPVDYFADHIAAQYIERSKLYGFQDFSLPAPHVQEMSSYIGQEAALCVTSGTAAIHLALRWFGVGPGDLVFCSDFTFAGSCNPILYQGATPVFIDSEPYTWNMSYIVLEKAFQWAESQGKMPKAVIVVDLYGESANWDKILPVCRKYGVPVIEDAAEAVGSTYKGKKCGSFGDVNVLSFLVNKFSSMRNGIVFA